MPAPIAPSAANRPATPPPAAAANPPGPAAAAAAPSVFRRLGSALSACLPHRATPARSANPPHTDAPRNAALPTAAPESARAQHARLTAAFDGWAATQVDVSAAVSNKLKQALALSELRYGLGQAQALRALNLSGNLLTSIPAELGQVPAVSELDLGGNRLTSIPAELGQAQALRRLYLVGNLLTSIPAELGQAQALRELDLRGNRLTSIPAELGQAPALSELDLRGNQLTSIPAELMGLHTDCTVELSGNPLSEQVIADMHALMAERRAQGLSVPNIFFDRHTAGAGGVWGEQSDLAQARPLSEVVGAWYVGAGADAAPPAPVQTAAAQAGDSAAGLSRLLDRLPGTAEFENAATRPGLQARVRLLLDAAASSPELMATCNAAALEGLGTCGDRVALTFDNLELQVRLHQIAHQGQLLPHQHAAALLALGAGAHRRHVLEEFARAKVKTMRMVDAIEVHLAFQNKFGQRVLSNSHGMLYECFAYLKGADFKRATAALDSADKPSNAAQRCEFLAEWAPWRQHLEVQHKQAFEAEQALFSEQLNKLSPDDVADPAITSAIMNTQVVALHKLATALTHEALK
jgi:hypothetical protein